MIVIKIMRYKIIMASYKGKTNKMEKELDELLWIYWNNIIIIK